VRRELQEEPICKREKLRSSQTGSVVLPVYALLQAGLHVMDDPHSKHFVFTLPLVDLSGILTFVSPVNWTDTIPHYNTHQVLLLTESGHQPRARALGARTRARRQDRPSLHAVSFQRD